MPTVIAVEAFYHRASSYLETQPAFTPNRMSETRPICGSQITRAPKKEGSKVTPVWVPQGHARSMLMHTQGVNGNSKECCALTLAGVAICRGCRKIKAFLSCGRVLRAIRKVLSSFTLMLFEGHAEYLTGNMLVAGY